MLKWFGGPLGGVVLNGQSAILSSVPEVIEFVNGSRGLLSFPQVTFLGACTLYMAIRDYGSGREGDVLQLARRALDSFDPQLDDAAAHAAFHAGVSELQDALFEHRSKPQNELVDIAYAWLQGY